MVVATCKRTNYPATRQNYLNPTTPCIMHCFPCSRRHSIGDKSTIKQPEPSYKVLPRSCTRKELKTQNAHTGEGHTTRFPVDTEPIKQSSKLDLYLKSKRYLRKSCRKIFHILASNILHNTVKEVQRRKLLLPRNLKVERTRAIRIDVEDVSVLGDCRAQP